MSATLDDLTGQMLIAMPGMEDPRFANSLVFMVAHSEEGAMGLIVNKPTPEVRFGDLLDQLEITGQEGTRDIRVHFGGPVETSRGFVLHSPDYSSEGATLPVTKEVSLTGTIDVLEALAKGAGPTSAFLALGYAGWAPGQLESEIQTNSWLTCPGQSTLVYGRAHEHKWSAALKSIGIDPLVLSDTAGRA